jgi:hypothetical protein
MPPLSYRRPSPFVFQAQARGGNRMPPAAPGFYRRRADGALHGVQPRQPAEAKYYYNTWKDATGWCDGGGWVSCGTLYAGRNYFYHQCPGARWEDQGNYNHWWAWTDLDSPGGTQGWVSAVYFTVGGQDEPIPGLPRGNC